MHPEDLAKAVKSMDGLQVQLTGPVDPEKEEYLSYLRALVFDVQKLIREYLNSEGASKVPHEDL